MRGLNARLWRMERRLSEVAGITEDQLEAIERGFENVANLAALPATGSYVVALPMKIAGGSGGPLRIVAFVPLGGTATGEIQ